MADRNVTTRKKRKVSLYEARMNLRANRRFQSEEDPDQEANEFKKHLGEVQSIDEWIELERELHESGASDAEKARSRIIGKRQGQGEGARRFIFEGDQAREREQDLSARIPEDLTPEAISVLRRQEKAKKRILNEATNKRLQTAENKVSTAAAEVKKMQRKIKEGKATKQETDRLDHLQRKVEKARDELNAKRDEVAEDLSPYVLEDQESTRVRNRLHDVINKEPQERYAATGGPTDPTLPLDQQTLGGKGKVQKERVRFSSPEEEARAEALHQRRLHLKSLEGKIANSPDLGTQGIKRRPDMGNQVMSEAAYRVRKERKEVEAELSKIKPRALVRDQAALPPGPAPGSGGAPPRFSGARRPRVERTAEETQRLAENAMRSAFSIRDPRAPEDKPSKPLQVANKEQINSFIHHTVQSYHGASHFDRYNSSVKAERLANEIAKQTQSEVEKAKVQAQLERIRREIMSPSTLTHEAQVKRAMDTAGVDPLSRLKAERESMEGFKGTPGDRVAIPKVPKGPPPPPENFPPGQHSWLPRNRPSRPFDDPRIGLSVEEIYQAYNHERVAPRLAWEKERLRAKFTHEPIDESTKPVPFEALRAQGRFLKTQGKSRWKAITSGSDVLGVDSSGKLIAFNSQRGHLAQVGTTPNILYEYKLVNPKAGSPEAQHEAMQISRLESLPETESNIRELKAAKKRLAEFTEPIVKRLPPTDNKTTFRVGRRNNQGQLIYGDTDEIVAPVTTVPWQEKPYSFTEGKRVPKKAELLPKGIDEIRYIASPGAKGHTLTVEDHEHKKTIPLIKTAEGRWREADSRLEWNQTEEALRSEDQVPRQIQYKYLDPKLLKLESRARDVARIRIPGTKRLGGRLEHLQFSEESTRVNDLIGKPARAHYQSEKLDLARRVREGEEVDPAHLNAYGIRDKSEARQLASAAFLAGYYLEQRKIKEGHLPNAFNKSVKTLNKVSPKTAGFIEKHLGDITAPVEEAFVRPGIEKAANVAFGLKHPLTSPTGEAFGIGITGIRDRQEWINRQKMAERAVAKQARRVDDIERTLDFINKNEGKKGPVGGFVRWRKGALQRHPDYQFGSAEGALAKAMKTAEEISNESKYTYFRDKFRQPAHVNLTSEHAAGAAALLKHYQDVEDRMQIKSQYGAIPSMRVKKQGFFDRALEGHFNHTERNILLGGALVGTTIGAGYLYHRHQESKKPEEERTSFHNKVLPPVFHGPPLPHVRVTQKIKFGDTGLSKELGFAGKELPTELGVSMRRKKIALRPVDRGYEKKQPIIGNISVKSSQGTRSRNSLTYYHDDPMKRTGFRRGTHEMKLFGKKLPGTFEIGELKKIPTSATNPRRMRRDDIENLVWAHAGTPREAEVRNFYAQGSGRTAQAVLDLFDNPEEIARIRKQKGLRSPESRAFTRSVLAQARRVQSATPR